MLLLFIARQSSILGPVVTCKCREILLSLFMFNFLKLLLEVEGVGVVAGGGEHLLLVKRLFMLTLITISSSLCTQALYLRKYQRWILCLYVLLIKYEIHIMQNCHICTS